ncbi:ammonium transporter 3 member 1 [Arachis ipaensis]|uniref:ammonium transporter 3 member 1 n=1 Tax=Arachis ipaensis TaxID=130454 RepID=UPI000A2B97AA|nr:ammonium transporter 3 member 1 [Arachis ipaensis]
MASAGTPLPVAYQAWTSPAVPDWLNKGDNAWQMVSATLVGIQSMPGLVILYGSIVKKKWAVNSAFMALYAFAAVVICWVTWAYKMSFGDKLLPFWGKAGPALGQKFLIKQAALPATPHYYNTGALETAEIEPYYPMATMVWFQCVFAAIAVVILAGSVLARMNFKAWMMFVPLWLTFSYTIGAFSLWGGGFLFQWGVMDYSGGYVIHLSSGVAGFTAAYWCLLVWTWLDVIFFNKPSVIGAVQGMITGLVCITPAAGLVQGWAAIVMGVLSGSVPWYTMMVLGKKLTIFQIVDDTLAVFHTHAVAGLLGGILTGFLAEPRLSSLFLAVTNSRGAVYGGSAGGVQILKQLVGGLFVIGWNLVATSIICVVVKLVVPLRMTDEELLIGDDAVHGEEAYALWGDGEKLSLYKDDTTQHGMAMASSGATQVV